MSKQVKTVLDEAALQKRLDQAKITLMRKKKTLFFSSILSMMKIHLSNRNDTAWTNGLEIGISPKFLQEQSTEQLIWVLLHEIGHVIYDHITIAMENKLDHYKHNIAGDHYINLWLNAMGYQEPTSIQVHADKKYRGWSSMKIYNALPDVPPGQKSNVPGMGSDIVLPNPKDKSKVQQKIKDNIIKAAIQTDALGEPGSIPNNIRRFVDEACAPQLPWQQILQHKMSAYNRGDYSNHRPNRRYLPDFYLPSMLTESMGHMICAVDTSGSIWQELLEEIAAEVTYVWQTLQPTTMRLITFDTKIHTNHVYNQGDSLDDMELTGGGGTNVVPVMEYVQKEDPTVALIFTDGEFSMPKLEQMPSDIYWVIRSSYEFKPPQGTVIYLPKEA